jgi:hypothetical protein
MASVSLRNASASANFIDVLRRPRVISEKYGPRDIDVSGRFAVAATPIASPRRDS